MIYDFKNPEHFKELEKQAYDGSIDVTGFPPAAYRYFDSLKKLYAEYKYDNLDKDEAQSRKKKLLDQYKEAVEVHENFCAVYREHQDNIRRAGTLLSDIEKADDVKAIALKACECIGFMTGDREFLKRQAKKIMEEKHDKNRKVENEMYVQSASWKLRYDEDYDDEIHCCSICGEPDAISRDDYSYRGGKIRDNDSAYCPHCGAKMDGGDDRI